MLEYIDNSEGCRSALLESYFGVSDPKECGVCDICLSKKGRDNSEVQVLIEREIVRIVGEGSCDLQQLAAQLKKSPPMITKHIERLVARGEIKYEGPFLVSC